MRTAHLCLLAIGLAWILAGQESPSPVALPREPDSFLGVNFLDPEEQAKSALNFNQCGFEMRQLTPEQKQNTPPDKWFEPNTRYCTATLELNNWQVIARFRFINDRLVQVSGTFEPDKFDGIKKYFEEKYGPATMFRQSDTVGAKGEHHVAESAAWKGKRTSLIMTSSGPTPEMGSFTIGLIEGSAQK